MNEFLTAYGVNTAASCFDLLTTAIIHKRTGSPNEWNKQAKLEMQEKGPRAVIEGEMLRRISYLATSLIAWGGEEAYSHIYGQEVFPFHLLILYGPALFYFGAGLINLIPIAFNKGDGNDVF